MPNHVINEVVFAGDSELRERVRKLAVDKDGKIEFELLLPVPLYCWMGSVGSLHEKTFPDNALNWCTKHWGTKWGAYGKQEVTEDGDVLTLRFDTAWNPPFGWYAALFNTVRHGFTVNWLSEGESRGHTGTFGMEDQWGFAYTETDGISEELQRHLHLLRWGVEEWPPEEDDEEPASISEAK